MSASVEGGRVPLEHVAFLWPHVEPMIAKACERGGGDLAQIRRDVHAEHALLWIVNRGPSILAVAVTQIWLKGERRLCTVAALGGHGLSRFLPLRAMLEQYAADADCDAMEVCGRPGWARILGDYKVKRVVMEKELRQ